MIAWIKTIFNMKKLLTLQEEQIKELKLSSKPIYVTVRPPESNSIKEYQRMLSLIVDDERYLWYFHALKSSFYADFEEGKCTSDFLKGALSVMYRIFDDSILAKKEFEANNAI